MRPFLLFPSFPLPDGQGCGTHVLPESDAASMSEKRNLAGKPSPKFLSRSDAMTQFHALARAYHLLGSALLNTEIVLLPEDREELLYLMKVVKDLDEDGA